MGDYYFNKDTDAALVKFQECQDIAVKQEIFNKEIRPAFEKLIESIIYVYKFYTIDDIETLKRECLSNLYEMIPKYDPAKSNRGFSYFNAITKNWFIQKIREKNKKAKVESDLYVDLDHESVKHDPNFVVSPYEQLLEEREWWVKFYAEIESWRGRLTKKSELQVLESVIFLMKHPDLINIYNKKAIYLYLREMTGLNTKQVVINLKRIKGLYLRWRRNFASTGERPEDDDDDGFFEDDELDGGDQEEYSE